MAVKSKTRVDFHTIMDMKIEVARSGKGAPLVVFADEEGLTLEGSLIGDLSKSYEVIVPSPPGFGQSDRPDWLENADDVSYVMLDLLDELGIESAAVLGFSFGGWLAAEMATKTCAHMSKLVLVDPYGIKAGGPFDRDIQDIWYLPPAEVQALKYSDPKKGDIDYTEKPEEELTVVARNRESLARLGWKPYLHNPKLKARLHRITVPTLVVWGADDGIVSTDYGKAFAAEIAGAKFETVAKAGHYPHLEQPKAFSALVNTFLGA